MGVILSAGRYNRVDADAGGHADEGCGVDYSLSCQNECGHYPVDMGVRYLVLFVETHPAVELKRSR